MKPMITQDTLDRLRRETPACEQVVHFNNAGAGLMPAPVLRAQLQHLQREAETGGYEAAAEAREQQRMTYASIAELLGAQTTEISLVENATRAWGQAFYGLDWNPGDRVVTASASYASNFLAMLDAKQRFGIEIDVAPDDQHGQIDVDALDTLVGPRTRLIAITHMPTNGGLVNPAEEVGRVARTHGVPYLLDACQTAGQLPLDVEAIGCDMLSGTGRKFLRGPRGTGFLYVSGAMRERLRPPMPDLHAAEWQTPDSFILHADGRRFETWEGHVAGKIALGVAVRYALDLGLTAIAERVQHLAEALRDALWRVPGVMVFDLGVRKGGIVTFAHSDVDAPSLRRGLREQGVNVSVAVPNSTLLDARRRDLPPMVRASVHYYNDEEEIERFIAALRALLPH